MTGGVLVVGDVIDDVLVRPSGPIRPDTDTPSRIERTAGGSAANTACWLTATGTPASLIATVGADDLDRCAAELARHGVLPLLTGAEGRTTGTIVVLSRGEDRTMLTDRGANLETGPERVTPALLAAHEHLHVTGHVFTGRDRDVAWRALLDDAAAAGLRRSVAPGSAGLIEDYGPDRFRELVAGVEVLVASEEEALLLTGETDVRRAASALAAQHDLAAVTRGPGGALLATAEGLRQVVARPAVVADVTGAGDAWVAGLLAGLVAGEDLAAAGDRAAALAAEAVRRVGARPAQPVRPDDARNAERPARIAGHPTDDACSRPGRSGGRSEPPDVTTVGGHATKARVDCPAEGPRAPDTSGRPSMRGPTTSCCT